MRIRRIGFALLALFVLVSALYTGEAIYYYVLILLCCMLVVSLVSLAIIALQFNYVQAVEPKVGVKGNTVSLDITLYNDTLFIFPFISLYYQLLPSEEDGVHRSSTFSVLPRSHARIHEELFCAFRGTYRVGLVRVEFSDIFGLFRVSRKVTEDKWQKPLYLKIMPRIAELHELPIPSEELESLSPRNTRRTEDTAQINSLREYRVGDTLRTIHWKASAKTGMLMVKEYEQQAAAAPLLYLDCATGSLPEMERLRLEDTLLECAVSVSSWLMKAGLPVELVLYNPHRIGQRFERIEEFEALYQYFGNLAMRGTQPMETILTTELSQLNHVGCVYIITLQITAVTFELLTELTKTGSIDLTVFWVHLPSEEDFSPERARMLIELKNHGIHVFEISTDAVLEEAVMPQ